MAIVILGNLGWIKLFIGKEFHSALFVVPWLIFGNIVYGIYYNVSVWYKITDLTKFAILLTSIGVIVNASINVLWLAKYGIMVSALAKLMSYFCMLLVSVLLANKHYKIEYQWRKIIFGLMLVILTYFITLFVHNLWVLNMFVLFSIVLVYQLFGYKELITSNK
ncbi:MAG: hypothetical protein HC831_24820 [Chloroflexia bacterium]|nr:hypothetical protein [Chloroflexia bacterium]